jgi:saccharopine dehydrogenase-like NADP-dependent oxidoreductase
MKKIIVLGGGMVGSVIADDLCNDFDVTISDKNSDRLEQLKNQHKINTTVWDLSKDRDLKDFLEPFDLVIEAVPGNIGFEVLQAIISAGKNVVDISFFEHDPFELKELADAMNVTAVVDCGVAPGLSNLILGFHNEQMEIDSFKCYVGGLPFKRNWPYQYKAFFSPTDVIHEYLRPARYMVNNKLVVKEALSDPEFIEVDGIGTLEAFNTDGLRTLLHTMKIPNMIEKTLRYPGHRELMNILKYSGFLDEEEIRINDQTVRPIDLTSKLLFRLWKPEIEDDEFTVMKLFIRGNEKNEKKEYVYEIFDKFDEETKTTSMARTTGYTCTAVARLILDGGLNNKGIFPPEYVGAIPGYCEKVLDYLLQRNIQVISNELSY